MYGNYRDVNLSDFFIKLNFKGVRANLKTIILITLDYISFSLPTDNNYILSPLIH